MPTHTDRDKIWNTALKMRENHTSERDGFQVRDVREAISGEVSKKETENTLKTMASMSYLKREGGGWRADDTYWNPEG